MTRILIHLVNGIRVGKDHIIAPGELHYLTLLLNAIVQGEESHIQGIEELGIEVRMQILPVTPNMMRLNARRKGGTKPAHLILILVIMNTRKEANLVVEDHRIKTEEAKNILDTTSTEERIMQNIHERKFLECIIVQIMENPEWSCYSLNDRSMPIILWEMWK
jgi:hypothetical protein